MLLSKEDVLGEAEISTGTYYKQTFTEIFDVTKIRSYVSVCDYRWSLDWRIDLLMT
jgi:hypothetical protein